MKLKREPELILNLSDPEQKRKLIGRIYSCLGLWGVRLRPKKPSRSLSQNGYYWSEYIPKWQDWLQKEWGDPTITTEQAHIELKKAVLGTKKIFNDHGGVLTLVPDSHDMDTTDFGIYLDHAAKFLAEFAGIVIQPASAFLENQ